MHPELIEFGERILFQPLDHKRLGSAQPRLEDGVFVGIRMHTGEKLVATAKRECKTRSIRRRSESERWDADEIAKVTATPWNTYISSVKMTNCYPGPPCLLLTAMRMFHKGSVRNLQQLCNAALLF